ncbi:MAG: hypothetical protein GX591_18665 [Planctomycetes bacterium]|nr:hypothetical protein [Planctomycetota bacterium]
MQVSDVEIRPYPYPYRAMLAICSDLDRTPDRFCYERIMRFCNTTAPTPMGDGVALEVGNSIYFSMPPDQFAYWNTDSTGRAMVRALIRSGHIDTLHSFGDWARTRTEAGAALDELSRHDCMLAVWVDHATAPTNFGADIMAGHGDEMGHEAYHADLSWQYGIRYVWRGRVTSVIGQDTPPRLGGVWSPRYPVASTATVAREAVKHVIGKLGHHKYAMHGPNRVMRPARLRDGTAVMEFMRSNPHAGGVSCGETGRRLGEVLTYGMLRRLIDREGVCLLYTHLGKGLSPAEPLPAASADALRLLRAARDAGDVLVATTRRVLGYLAMRRSVQVTARLSGWVLRVDVRLGDGRAGTVPPAGLTVYVPPAEADTAELYVNDRRIDDVLRCPPDHTGRPSLSIPWKRLEFPTW